MKRRSFICYFLLCLWGMTSCDWDEGIETYLELSSNALLFEPGGGVEELTVNSSTAWNVISELPPWISYSVLSDDRVAVAVQYNDSEDVRDCNVVFSAAGINDTLFVRQESEAKLGFLSKNILEYDSSSQIAVVYVNATVDFDLHIKSDGDWISKYSDLSEFQSKSQSLKRVRFELHENKSKKSRTAQIVVSNSSYFLADTLTLLQKGVDVDVDDPKEFIDGEYVAVQKSEKGLANLIVMGDGFTSEDLSHDGSYVKAVSQAIEYFFSIEPYTSYRDYFNVYMVIAESPSEGIGEKGDIGISRFNNKFDTAFGEGTEIVCNSDLVYEYAGLVKELEPYDPKTVIVVLNSTKYAGTAYLQADGNSIALCPMSSEEAPNDFEGVIHHEAGGHAFGFLCDEYVYYQKSMPSSRRENIREWQELGFYLNLDFTDDLSQILWKDFIGQDKYDRVGAYEGGYEYQFGVWRSEENSCMNNNIPYYNAQSRWLIVDRIMKLSGIEYSIHDFMASDHAEPYVETKTMFDEYFVPLGEPVLVR